MSRPALRALAERLGILPDYVGQTGRVVRTSDRAREALLGVMGFDAPTEDAARGWLSELAHEARSEIIAPVRVVERDAAGAARVAVRLPPGVTDADVELTMTEESGHVWRVVRRVRRSATIDLPTRAPYGYHTVTAEIRGAGRTWSADQSLIVVPATCMTPELLPDPRPCMGVVANLYATRREHDWGVGDFTTLTHLVEWAAHRRAHFVGVNPLHALFNRGWDVSPYSPVSRLFRNHLYVDVQAVPEWPNSEAARALPESRRLGAALDELRAGILVDYDRVIELKERVLGELHRAFRDRASPAGERRKRDFEAFVAPREPELTRHATWMAIAENAGVADWHRWPEPLRDPDSPEVRAFQGAHADRIDFHRWLQFETHRQLADAAQRARVLGMRIGVYQDLAIGTHPGGSDTWSYPDLFLWDAAVGAPPDPYSATGQNWGLPPIDPRALRRQRYRYWIQLLRHAFESSGALRIDHVMGLFRMFWIPNGGTGKDGAYVRFPARDLLGILALESVRHGAIVVGEDLGTVPHEVPRALRKWGILSSKVLLFERDRRGFRPAKHYPRLALATADTHDMAPLSGFWSGRDIEIRRQTGLIQSEAQLRRANREREHDQRALLRLLRLGEPRAYEQPHFYRKLAAAAHDFLCATPAQLVGVSLDDLVGETDPVNVPGVGQDRYPNWRRKSRMTVEAMAWSFEVDDAIGCADRRG